MSTSLTSLAGYSTLASGPVSDVAKGNPAQSIQAHGNDAGGAMMGTALGVAAGKFAGIALEKGALAGASPNVSRVVVRVAEESTGIAASTTASPAKDKKQ